VLTQENAGAARARHRGITAARGDLIVITDDDMQVSPDFLARHVSAHPAGSRRAVLGWVRLDSPQAMPLFERQYAEPLKCMAAEVAAGRELDGTNLYTGNVSFHRQDYLAVGGFDPSLARSEDAELGVRLEKAGVTLCFSEAARTMHSSDHTRLRYWMRRAFEYGVWDFRIGRKHPDVTGASPWRFLAQVNPISVPMLLAAVAVPSLTRLLAWLAMAVALAVDRLGASRLGLAGANFVWGLEYFRGVRAESGSFAEAVEDLRGYLRRSRADHRYVEVRQRPASLELPHAEPGPEVEPESSLERSA
jgi:glycosyltransferase involved in cell wall biosynthesis